MNFSGVIFPILIVPLILLFVAIIALLIKLIGKNGLPRISTNPTKLYQHDQLLYAVSDSLLTPAERSFYGVLIQSIDVNHIVMCKIRIADVLHVVQLPKIHGGNKSASMIAFNKIAKKHFDYVVCRRDDFSFQYVVELNDSSHTNLSRIERDKFIIEACRTARIPLIQIKAQSGYSIAAITGIIKQERAEQVIEYDYQ